MLDVQDAPAPAAGLRPGARIVVAMSGGVDSSVCAALLVEQGYDVVGITLQLYDHGAARARRGACCAGQDIHDARRVGEQLDIPHYVLDFEARFREAVIEDFAGAYASGRTPIPCVRCNQRIKFRDLLEVARDLGADGLATGHYVRKVPGPDGPELHRARDPGRDQSYFLFATTPEQLDYLHFPLGALGKDETRAAGRRLGLEVWEKPDSQDICFVPEGRYDRVVRKLRPEAAAPGEVVDEAGRVLGRHDGIAGFTVGQRRGLGLAGPARRYVTRVEPETRRVVIGPRAATMVRAAELDEVNWLLAAPPPVEGLSVVAKCRARQPLAPARWFPRGPGRARVEFETAQAAVAPGQALVAYAGERVLGGGWIARTGD